MACFVVPAAEAVVTTVVTKIVKEKEKAEEANKDNLDISGKEETIPFSEKLKWLNIMLWGGSFLLLFEHLWHGEVVPFFPFFTAAEDPGTMLREMATNGVLMALLVTAVWAVMVAVTYSVEKRSIKDAAKAQ